MRRNLLKRMIGLGLVAVMLMGVFSGCSDQKVQIDENETPEISAFIPWFKGVDKLQSVYEEIQKRANVKLKIIDAADSENAFQRSSLIITTGEHVNWVNIAQDQPFKEWGEEGFLTDLAPYLKKYKDELPILNFIANDELFESYKGENGEIYGISTISYLQNHGLLLNRTWLEKAGMKDVPKTTDEIYNMLKKFKETSGGDGKYAFAAKGMEMFDWAFLAFGGSYYKTSTPKYYEENGTFKPYDVSPMHKEAVKYLRKLHQEGLINSDWQIGGTDSETTFKAGRAGMVYTASAPDVRLYRATGDKTSIVPAPSSPECEGSYGGTVDYQIMTIPSSITSEKEIYCTLKFMEWMHSKEARILATAGIEGKHYEILDNGVYRQLPDAENEFSKSNSGCGFGYGWVSPFGDEINTSAENVIEAIKGMKSQQWERTEEQQQAEAKTYSEWLDSINKYVNVDKYSTYVSDELNFASTDTSEFVKNFYIRAITEPVFDIDAEWDKFVSEYYTQHNGQKCLDIFTEMVK
ncbi:extracellular solute-binding protein [Ructibacterium gallinarum]|uniref:Extracellular solute-binding protein n=1 Tax=Ructibacterium gallinarum TaxID=2779355 RepID=A0A9D5RBZ8_9FIRM|nr:extracellular solute-binding protein [Ructibacterium gallinarum]MBE5040513.1 extracellular solute-binding protein [Ructibacterium gallinarum]